jgi:hypothetical protein
MDAILVRGIEIFVFGHDHGTFLVIIHSMNMRNRPVRTMPPKTPPTMAGVDLETDFVAGRGRELEELTLDSVVVLAMLVMLGVLLVIRSLVVVLLGRSVADNNMV